MFHIKQIELVHWDFWRRFTLPLDSQIITIVGPNGSGKTTLLDALRTLFALRCSGKRDFRRYVRRADRSFAWIRAVVANRPGNTGKRPFFPCLDDEVTLACRIRRGGGEWMRDYTIVDGDVPIETLEEANDWLGLRDYQSRLAWGGLTPAIAKVLALEQGDTDKLCEYSPKALLELVFDVFGDKEVLDNYGAAREEQMNAERELADLAVDLDRLRAQADAKRLEADRFLEWKQLSDEASALDAEIVPRLEVAELSAAINAEREALARLAVERRERRHEQRIARDRLATVRQEREVAESRRARLRSLDLDADKSHLAAHDEVRDLEKLLAERDALRAQLAAEHGADAVALEREHEEVEKRLDALRRDERQLVADFEDRSEQLRNARSRRGPPADPVVSAFRQQLDAEGIAHQGLAEIVEVTDPAWQAAVEAVLRPYRHIVLLTHEHDRHAAWSLGERERFRHFIVPEREEAPPANAMSLAEVVRFSAPVPRWLATLLNRIRRVESVEAARNLPRDIEWITRDCYHREHRGARHLGRPSDFHFGELARQARIEALEAEVARLDAGRKRLNPQLDEAKARLTTLRQQLMGLQAGQLLAAKAAQYADAEMALPDAQRRLTAAIADRVDAKTALDEVSGQINGINIEIERRERDLRGSEQRLAEIERDNAPRRHGQAERIQKLRRRRRGMPAGWQDPQELAQLDERYGGAHGARRELERLRSRIDEGEWVTDAAVLTLRDRVAADVAQRERDYAERDGYCNTTRRLTTEARAAYIAKLRATVRQYGRNLKALGELAGVDVDCPTPHLENDDVSLNHAGLEVRFDFDRKGAVGLNDGEASGGQQVMKSLVLLIGLLMDDARPGGFVFIDEPFAHLDVANIDRVGSFLRATRAQYLITTPVTHNANIFAPSLLTLVTRKKKPGEAWAPPIGVIQRDTGA
ncbi:MAG: AAA family ATPase [Zoogloeaceae bacterium]|nr:AAA family ATPase [Zoogloeaceae bacterium]